MPIKVRCRECKTVLVAPDKALGKAVKCKSCGAAVKVAPPKKKKKPAAASEDAAPRKKAPQKKKRRKRPAPQAEPSFGGFGDDMFGNLDLGRADDGEVQICPSCAKEVDDEDVECPFCGTNIRTGAISTEQKKRHSRKGPPPEEFYGKVWSDGWAFVMNHKRFVFRTGVLWALSGAMVVLSIFVLQWYTRTREAELVGSYQGSPDKMVMTDTKIVFTPDGDDFEYDGVKYTGGDSRLVNGKITLWRPDIASWLSPPTYFWLFMLLVFSLSFGGWAWVLVSKIVAMTMAKEKKIKRFQGDVFSNMTRGFLTVFWPMMVMYPVIWVPGVVYLVSGNGLATGITAGLILLIPYVIFLPVAVIHMSQPYTYRAWLPNWMLKDLMATFVPSMFVAGIFFVTVLLVPLGIGIGVAVGWNSVQQFYTQTVEANILSGVGYTSEFADSTGSFVFFRMPLLFTLCFITFFILASLVALPVVFMMRVFGLFGLYFRPDLSLISEQPPLSPAGFGPRFLAMHVDALIVSLVGMVAAVISVLFSMLVGFLYDSETVAFYAQLGSFFVTVGGAYTYYFANWESGAGRATLGKWSLGLIVLNDDNTPVTFKTAANRAWACIVNVLTLFGTSLIVAFREDHKGLHDQWTNSKVVWRGDEDL